MRKRSMGYQSHLKNTLLVIFCHLLAVLPVRAYTESTNEEVFTEIYRSKAWGTNKNGEGHSGGGSTLAATRAYRKFIQEFLKDNKITSVVDVGCGDWEFSHKINWDGIQYLGIDVVKDVIAKDRAKYGSPTIQFIHGDATETDLPEADLLICKDVLQHLSNNDVFQFLGQLYKFKHCLITNDVNPQTLTSTNLDIPRGHYREIDLTAPPFLIPGTKILTYRPSWEMKQVLYYKPN